MCWPSLGSDARCDILLTVQYSCSKPLGQRCGHMDGSFGLDLSLLAGVGVASVPGLALPQQVKHLDDAIDTGRMSGASVLDTEFPLSGLITEITDDDTQGGSAVTWANQGAEEILKGEDGVIIGFVRVGVKAVGGHPGCPQVIRCGGIRCRDGSVDCRLNSAIDSANEAAFVEVNPIQRSAVGQNALQDHPHGLETATLQSPCAESMLDATARRHRPQSTSPPVEPSPSVQRNSAESDLLPTAGASARDEPSAPHLLSLGL